MTTTLITGANKGIGKATARQLLSAGHDVWIGARNEDLGRVAANEIGARFVQLDVLDDASVAAAVERVSETGLDVLINNAAHPGPFGHHPRDVTPEVLGEVFATNVLGVVRVTGAFLPLLEQSSKPVIVNVSSIMSSFSDNTNPEGIAFPLFAPEYSASKSALNMLMLHYAKALPDVRIHLVHPGHVATDFNDHDGPLTPDQGAERVVQMAQEVGPGPVTFSEIHGELGW